MDKERFQRLVGQYLDGSLTPAEEEIFYREILKKENSVHLEEALQDVWQAERARHGQRPPSPKGYRRIKRIMEKLPDRRKGMLHVYRIRRRWWWAAACALLALLGTGVWMSVHTVFNDRPMVRVRAVQETEHIALPDGTLVQLRKGSELSYRDRFSDSRDVWLSGEAFFDVARDEDAPFLLQTGPVTTEVLGTAFNVKAIGPEEVRVTVFRGRVRVAAGDMAELLTKNDQIDYHRGAFQLRRLAAAPESRDFHIGGKPLAFLTAVMSRRFGVRFHFADPALKDHVITTTFSTGDSLEDILEIIALVDKLQWRREGNDIFVR